MYEDQRRIDESGLLTAASRPKYIPEKVDFGLNPEVGRPPDDWVNVDKDRAENDRRYKAEQDRIAAEQWRIEAEKKYPPHQPKQKGKVICTRMYELGYLEKHIYEADQLYGEIVYQTNPGFMAWYHENAGWWLEKMHGNTLSSKLFIKALWLFVKPWSHQMAWYMGKTNTESKFGKLIMDIGNWIYDNSRQCK